MRTVFTACGDALIMHRLPENYPGQMQIQEYLKTGDFRIVNLETTITDKNCYPSTFSGGTWLTAEAPVLDDLLDFGFNLWGIANNHMLDYSYRACSRHFQLFDSEGLPLLVQEKA